MSDHHQNDLALLSEVLVQIRGIAGDASGLGHVSTAGHRYFSSQEALAAIYQLADAAHNIPTAIADGPGQGAHFLLDGARGQVVRLLRASNSAQEDARHAIQIPTE